MSALAPTLQAFFTERLIGQRHASPNTIAAYRDTLRLLLGFASRRLGRQPCQLDIGDLDAPLIAAFLSHLETERGNSVRTRNARLAAVHSLYRFAAHRHPEHAEDIQRILAIPPKRADRALVTFLEQEEIDALLAAPDRSAWTGRRSRATAARDPDRAARLGAGRAGLRRPAAHNRSSRQLPGQGTQTAHHPTDRRHGRRPARLARRTRRRFRGPAVSHHPRRAAQPRRARTTTRQARRPRRGPLPKPAPEEGHAAHAPAHRSDAAAGRRRHDRDRAVARP
jgi:Phage integrase, N-terminal SAM-like domain